MAQVENNPDASRYEAVEDGEVAGFAAYVLTDELVVFTHTEVDPAYEGRGIGSLLARTALDDVRAQGGRRVLAVCPFITAWIGRNPEYGDLLFNAPASSVTD